MTMCDRDQWIVIGISGVTCGGKTTLANQLKGLLTPVYVFHQDKYFYPDDSAHHLRCEGLDHNNYDILSALDMPRMHREVLETMAGADRSHGRSLEAGPGRLAAPGKKFMILEGFTVLNYPPLLELCDLRYYFVLEYSECVSRRAFRLYDPPDIDGYFEQCVWPEHLRYRAEIEKEPRVNIVDGTRHDALQIVRDAIAALLTPPRRRTTSDEAIGQHV